MNRKVLSILCSALLAGAGAAVAQGENPSPATPKPAAPSTVPPGQMVEQSKETKTKVEGEKSAKKKTHTVIGNVTELEAGKKLKVEDVRKKSHSFDLDEKGWSVTVDPSVAVGSSVKVTEMKEGDTKTRTVEPYTPKTKSSKKKSSKP